MTTSLEFDTLAANFFAQHEARRQAHWDAIAYPKYVCPRCGCAHSAEDHLQAYQELWCGVCEAVRLRDYVRQEGAPDPEAAPDTALERSVSLSETHVREALTLVQAVRDSFATQAPREIAGSVLADGQLVNRVMAALGSALAAAESGKSEVSVTRLEVVDESGRAYTNGGAREVRLSYQDEGRTLKVFCAGKHGAKLDTDAPRERSETSTSAALRFPTDCQ